MVAEKQEPEQECAADCLLSINEYIHRGTNQISQLVQEGPTRSIVVTCLAGFGVGLILSRFLSREEPHRSSGAFDRQTAERFGRNLLQKVEQVLPTVIRERLGN